MPNDIDLAQELAQASASVLVLMFASAKSDLQILLDKLQYYATMLNGQTAQLSDSNRLHSVHSNVLIIQELTKHYFLLVDRCKYIKARHFQLTSKILN